MNCESCGHGNRPEARFCAFCGQQLERVCSACQEVNPASSIFCDHCGTKFIQSSTNTTQPGRDFSSNATVSLRATAKTAAHPTQPGNAERRHLTVMFCDLVNSTGLSELLDPEDMRNLLADYQTLCRNATDRFGGHIARYVGDGLLVYFGYPVAFEDAAIRAIHAGLEIVESISSLEFETLKPDIVLAVRIGINTGNVVVGDIGIGDSREQMAVVGDVPNVAARLQSKAQPGTIVIGDSTRRLVGNFFELESLGTQTYKGVTEPIKAHQVVGSTTTQYRLAAIDKNTSTNFVGREAEISLLHERWKQVKEGKGQVLVLAGEAGIGKSSILRQFRKDLRGQRYHKYFYYCSSHHHNSAFYPIIVGIEQELGFEVNDSDDTKLEKIESHLQPNRIDLDEIVPLFALLLGVSMNHKYPVCDLNPMLLKRKIFRTLIDQYRKIASKKPLLMIVEDLHWIDPSTIELMENWIQEFNDAPCLLVLTFRPDFELPWRHQSNFTSLTLNRLSREESYKIVNEITCNKSLPAQVLNEIMAKTDGVPLFLEELTKMIIESDLLQENNGVFKLDEPLPSLAIPESLKDSLAARLDKLGAVKDIAQLAATLGRRFSHRLLAAVSGLTESDLEHAINQLLDAELIVKRGFSPDVVYDFKHALVQETAYRSLLVSTRTQYHHRIAQSLENHFHNLVENNPELVAYHYTEANIPDRAIIYWCKAGQKAISRSANLEAIQHIQRGLGELDALPDDLARTKLELELQITLAVPQTSVNGYASPEVEKTYTRARELCLRIGDTPQLFPAIYGMWRFYLLRADYATAQTLSKQLNSIAEQTGDHAYLTAARRSAGGTLFYQGRLTEARRSLEQVLSSNPSEADRSRALLFDVVDALVATRSYNAWALWLQGYPDQARQQSELALDVANGLNHQFSLALANSFASWTYEFCGDMRRTKETALTALELSKQFGFQFWVGWTTILLGRSGFNDSNIENDIDPFDSMKQGLQEWRNTGSQLGQSYFLTLLAEALASKQQFNKSFELLDEAESFSNQTGEAFWLPEIYRVKGELLLTFAPGKENEAEQLFKMAQKEASIQRSKSLELRAIMSLYRLHQSTGNVTKVKQAHDTLIDIYEFFSEGFDTADLNTAKLLLQI